MDLQPKTCDEANPAGLSDFMYNEIGGGFLTECARTMKHTGTHTNTAKNLFWHGPKLNATERERARTLRLDALNGSISGLLAAA